MKILMQITFIIISWISTWVMLLSTPGCLIYLIFMIINSDSNWQTDLSTSAFAWFLLTTTSFVLLIVSSEGEKIMESARKKEREYNER